MEAKTPKKKFRRELTEERKERLKEYAAAMKKERNRRKEIMLKRRAYFESLIGDSKTFEEYYEKSKELALLWGADMSYMTNKSDEISGIYIWIQLDYTEYECYYIYSKDGRLHADDTVSWQNEACANEDWNIMSSGENEGEDDGDDD